MGCVPLGANTHIPGSPLQLLHSSYGPCQLHIFPSHLIMYSGVGLVLYGSPQGQAALHPGVVVPQAGVSGVVASSKAF